MKRLLMLRIASALTLGAVLTAACATPIEHATPSGKPEITVAGALARDMKGLLVGAMMNNGYTITKDSDYLVAFDKPVENFLAAALLGSQYDAQPNARVQFQIATIQDSTRVVADFAVITNPGSAFERRTPMNNSQDSVQIQRILNGIAAELNGGNPLQVARAQLQPVAYSATPTATTDVAPRSIDQTKPSVTAEAPAAAMPVEPRAYTPPQFRKY